MIVLKLCEQMCPEKIPHTVGSKLGDGADGEVFNIKGQPNKVIKFCVLYEYSYEKLEEIYPPISEVISGLRETPEPVCARVHAHAFMGQFTRTWYGNSRQRYYLYYYVMEKLQEITEDEGKVFDSLISHEDLGKKKNFGPAKVKKMLTGLARGLDFDAERVTFFIDNYKKSPVQHLDVHTRNIMKDAAGNFKLIDFDRAQIIRR